MIKCFILCLGLACSCVYGSLIDKISFYKEEQRGVFCATFKTKNAIKDGQISVKDPSGKTFGHFLCPLKSLWYGVFLGEGDIQVQIHISFANPNAKDIVAKVKLQLPKKTTKNKELLRKWAQAQNKSFFKLSQQLGESAFLEYAILSRSQRFSLPLKPYAHFFAKLAAVDLPPWQLNVFDLQKEQQTQSFLLKKFPTKKEIDIAKLSFTLASSSTFPKNYRSPVFSVMANLIPKDHYYLHFNSISKMNRAIEQFPWDFFTLWQSESRDFAIGKRMLTALGMADEEEGDSSGSGASSWVIGELAFTGRDFSFADGSEFAALLQIKNSFLFNFYINSYIKAARKQGASYRHKKYLDIAYQSLEDSKRHISMYTCILRRNVRVYSNSEDFLKRIIETSKGERPSLTTTRGFRYTRAVFPGHSEREDGFLYVSKPFFQAFFNAKTYIAARRRALCIGNLYMLKYAALLYKMERQKWPSVPRLKQLKMLPAVLCQQGGNYHLKEGKPSCSIHNQLGYITSIWQLPVSKISLLEKEEYQRFVKKYHKFAHSFAISAKTGKKKFVLEAFSPISKLPYYQKYKSYANLQSQLPLYSTSKVVVAIGAHINNDLLKQLPGFFPDPLKKVVSKLESPLCFYICDHLTTEFPRFEKKKLWQNISSFLTRFSLPSYVTLSVKDKEQIDLSTLISRLNWWAKKNSSLWQFSEESFNNASYFVAKTSIWGASLKIYALKFRQQLILTNRFAIVEAFIKGKIQQRTIEGNIYTSLTTKNIHPLDEAFSRGFDGLRLSCMRNFADAYLLYHYHSASILSLESLSQKLLGYKIICPEGGKYLPTSKYKIECSIHGNFLHARKRRHKLSKYLPDTEITGEFWKNGIKIKVILNK